MPSLDAPVPLVVEKLVDVLAFVEQKKQEDARMNWLEDLILEVHDGKTTTSTEIRCHSLGGPTRI